MDSRSGPELPHKVHGFRETVKRLRPDDEATSAMSPMLADAAHRPSLIRMRCIRRLGALAFVVAAACGSDPRTVEGALAAASGAVAARDHAALFRALDPRARDSLSSVYFARKAAAEEIRASYPPAAQPPALRELGDALQAESDVALFALRCPDPCLDALAGSLGAPRSVQVRDRISTVTTVRDTEAQLYRADDGSYGLVWESAALMRERTRAAAELDLIKKNGAQYRAQRELSKGAR
jgi:hypothetical protein